MNSNCYFTAKELNCKCGCGLVSQPILISMLNQLRANYGSPLVINSAARCEKRNAAVGGAKNSQHCKGRAVDINTRGFSDKEIERLVLTAKKLGFRGFGFGLNFLHIDCRIGLVVPRPVIVSWEYDTEGGTNGKAN